MAANLERKSGEALSVQARAEIDRWIAKYPPDRKQAAIMGALTVVQEENGGWLTPELIAACADYLGIAPIAAHEVATFYSLYDLKPVGRHKIYVCTNISCWLCGSNQIVEHLKKKLSIGFGETTGDQRFMLKEAECLAACGGAPAMMIGGTYYENLTPEKVDAILDKLK